MSNLKQENRQIWMDTPLGKDYLILTSFTGSEQFSRLFSYQLEAVTEFSDLAPADIIGKKISFGIKLGTRSKRCFSAHVRSFHAVGREGPFLRYKLELVPWFWFLSQTQDCRVFQKKSVVEIAEDVFARYGMKDFDFSGIKGTHDKWEYCVQYRESAFDFVSRLFEQEGIFYYFKHSEEKHMLKACDDATGYYACDTPNIEQSFAEKDQSADYDGVTEWRHSYSFIPGKFSHTDYNFDLFPPQADKTPFKKLFKDSKGTAKIQGNEQFEVFEYPAQIEKVEQSQSESKIRMQQIETSHDIANGQSACRNFAVGAKFTFASHELKQEVGKSYVITSVSHMATESANIGGIAGAVFDYVNSFSVLPSTVVFRPPRFTRWPVISGSQTAVVTGPPGEEIHVDKHGRVKVQFFWDRVGVRNADTSCFVRVSQIMAGKNWGAMFIPRIGQEVVVSFVDGDPDRPIITGVVYNSEQTPLYKLPDEMTKSYIRTNSSKSGDGFNELRFEDLHGKEQIFIHAQKDMDVRVKNDHKERILGNFHSIIGFEKDGKKGGDLREKIFQDHTLNIKRNHVEHVEGNYQLTVGKGGAAQPAGDLSILVEKKTKITSGDDMDVALDANLKETVAGTHSTSVTGDFQQKVGKNFAVETAMEIHVKAGMTLILEAGVQISLKVGGNFIDISPAGVTISGMLVNINSGGAAGSGSGAKPEKAEKAEKANPAVPAEADNSKTGQKSSP